MGTPAANFMGGLNYGPHVGTLRWPKRPTQVLCKPPEHGPCHGYIDTAFAVGHLNNGSGLTEGVAESGSRGDPALDDGDEPVEFVLQSHGRMAGNDRRLLFHHQSALCFYPDDGTPKGFLVGWVEFHMDGPDVQAFVGSVCFFAIGLPAICMITALLHVN